MIRWLASGLVGLAAGLALVAGPGRRVARDWRGREPGVPFGLYDAVHPATVLAAVLSREDLAQYRHGCLWRPMLSSSERRFDREHLVAPFRYHCHPRGIEFAYDGDDLRRFDFMLVQEAYEVLLHGALGRRPHRRLRRVSGWALYVAEAEGDGP